MAAIDKIYGNSEQCVALTLWLNKTNPNLLQYVRPAKVVEEEMGRLYAGTLPVTIAQFPAKYDYWLVKNSPFDWLTDQILDSHGVTKHDEPEDVVKPGQLLAYQGDFDAGYLQGNEPLTVFTRSQNGTVSRWEVASLPNGHLEITPGGESDFAYWHTGSGIELEQK